MGKVYEGRFGIRANAKGEIVLAKPKAGTQGKYTAADAAVVLKRVQALAKEHKLVARLYKPDPKATEPVILADKWGSPYLAVLGKTAHTTKSTVWFD
jgi:hypothetical protein